MFRHAVAEVSSDDLADPYPGLLRVGPLREWFDGVGLGPGGGISFERVAAGESNEVFIVRRGGSTWVLRRPSAVPLSVEGANRTMVREYRFQGALAGSGVPHARPLALCSDTEVTGAFFYVMEFVDGVVVGDPPPDEVGGPPAGRRVAEQMVDALAALAMVDADAVGVSDLGRPEGFLERQVGRWRSQLEGYRRRDLPGIDGVAGWLEVNRPTGTQSGIMHGDFNRHNMLFTREQPTRLAAVLDWENATVGDPLMDLGYLLSGWRPDDPGLPGREELVARWSGGTGRRPESLGWYAVMSTFKLACMLEGVRVRQVDDPTREETPFLADAVVDLVGRAEQLIGEAAGW